MEINLEEVENSIQYEYETRERGKKIRATNNVLSS